MPRTSRAYGRPGTVAVPSNWTESHAPTVAGWMTASVDLRAPGARTLPFDDTVGHTQTVPNAPFASGVPANIQAVTEGEVAASSVVDDQVRVLGYMVTVPWSTEVAGLDEGVLVDVVVSADPMLRGATLTVTDVVRGERELERILLCNLNS